MRIVAWLPRYRVGAKLENGTMKKAAEVARARKDLKRGVFARGGIGRAVKAVFSCAPKPNPHMIEFAITDYCNLKCRLCAHGTPLITERQNMSPAEFERLAGHFRPYEFYVCKISGGEPTLHPQFREIVNTMRRSIPAHQYSLATNGARLAEFVDAVNAFDTVDLSEYPTQNRGISGTLSGTEKQRTAFSVKRDYVEMMDVSATPNAGKSHISYYCQLKGVKKVVKDRIFPCCNLHGLALHRGLDPREVSVKLDGNWRSAIRRIDLEPYCRKCFHDAEVPPAIAYWIHLPLVRARSIFRAAKSLLAFIVGHLRRPAPVPLDVLESSGVSLRDLIDEGLVGNGTVTPVDYFGKAFIRVNAEEALLKKLRFGPQLMCLRKMGSRLRFKIIWALA